MNIRITAMIAASLMAVAAEAMTKAEITTSLGTIELELDEAKAPITVKNFVDYAKAGFYDGTIFHRVIQGFMIQGGGFTREMRQKETRAPIKNEAGNGLKNVKYTVAMARTQVVDSATAQFFINVKDNGFLDHRTEDMRGFGYAVFGRVTKGAEVVDKIAAVKTGSVGFFADVPVEPVVIEKVTVSADEPAPTLSAKGPFNGKDLAGWTAVVDYGITGGYSAAEPTWEVKDGAIRTTGTPFGYLRTQRADYADFRLRVEYRYWRATEKPNSGVFVRLANDSGCFIPTCYENQLCAGMACDVLALGGAAIDGVTPRDAYDPARPLSGIARAAAAGETSEKPLGEWNALEIEVRGDAIVSRLNGVERNRVKGLKTPKGAIALQSEGGAIEFRNLTIEDL